MNNHDNAGNEYSKAKQQVHRHRHTHYHNYKPCDDCNARFCVDCGKEAPLAWSPEPWATSRLTLWPPIEGGK